MGTPRARADREQRRVGSGDLLLLSLARVPQTPHGHGAEARREAAEVIRVRVRQDGRQHGAATPGAKLRRKDAGTHVDWTADEPSAVDHERFAVRQIEDRGVALPDVEERGAQQAARSPLVARDDFEHGQDHESQRHDGAASRYAARDRCQRDDDRHELPRRRLRDLGRQGRRGERPRDGPDQVERSRGDRGAAPLGRRPRREEGVDEAKRQRRRLAQGYGQQVRNDATDRHGRRETSQNRRARYGGGEGRARCPSDLGGDARRPGDARRDRFETIGERLCEGEEPGGRARGERERDVECDKGLGHRHGAYGEPERARRIATPAERARCERGRGHPRGAQRRATSPRELGVDPGDGDPDRGRVTSHVADRGEGLDPPERPFEDAHGERQDQDQVHPRDGEQVRQAAPPEGVVVVRCEVALAEHEGAGHGPDARVEGRVDAAPHPGALSIDPGDRPAGPPRQADVERAAGPYDSSKRLARPRVSSRRVPQSLRRGQRRHDVDLVAARELLRTAIDRGPASPGGSRSVARRLDRRVPPRRATDPDGRRVDPRVPGAAGWQRDDRVRLGLRPFVTIDARLRAQSPELDRGDHDRRGHDARTPPTNDDREDEKPRHRDLPRRDDRDSACGQSECGQNESVDRLVPALRALHRTRG